MLLCITLTALLAAASSTSLQKFDQKYFQDFPADLQFAHITPLDAHGNENPHAAFRGYVRMTPTRSYPTYYEILCSAPSYNIDLHSYFNALNQKLNELNDNFHRILGQKSDEQELLEGTSPMDYTDYNMVDSHYGQLPMVDSHYGQMQMINSHYGTLPPTVEKRPIQIVDAGSSQMVIGTNVNNQSGVFQCEGFTCPSATNYCKIAISSIQPRNDMLRHNVFCMSDDDDTIEEFEKVARNPNKGSVVNISKTFRPQNMQVVQEAVENKLKEAQLMREQKMKEMQEKMNKVFGKFKGGSNWDF